MEEEELDCALVVELTGQRKKGNWGQGDQGQMMLQERRRPLNPSLLGWEC